MRSSDEECTPPLARQDTESLADGLFDNLPSLPSPDTSLFADYPLERSAGSQARDNISLKSALAAGLGDSAVLLANTAVKSEAALGLCARGAGECGVGGLQVSPYTARSSSVPCLYPFPGDLGFGVAVVPPSTRMPGKQDKYEYTQELNKLYVDMLTSVPLEFSLSGDGLSKLPAGMQLFVRCMPVFPESQSLMESVRRCPAHRELSHASNRGRYPVPADHVTRAVHPKADYQTLEGARSRRSVVVPWPEDGCFRPAVVLYQLACMNTCTGGVARRRLALLFTLEDRQERVYGRQLLELKVCKCPRRDARHELGRLKRSGGKSPGARSLRVGGGRGARVCRPPRGPDRGDQASVDRSPAADPNEHLQSQPLTVPVANLVEYNFMMEVRDSFRRSFQ